MGKLLNAKQLAGYLNIHEKTIYKWLKRGRLPRPVKEWGSPRWDLDEVISFLRKRPNPEEKVAAGSL